MKGHLLSLYLERRVKKKMYNFTGILGNTENSMIGCIIMVIVAYFIGSISPAILIGRAKGIDIKKEGSGNAGTTNVLRVLGKKAAVATLLIDILKGTIAVVLGGVLFGEIIASLCVAAVFVGHVWPIYFGFKGGKGVATAFGALMGLNPMMGLTALAIVAVGVIISKRMSVGSILGAVTFPFVAYYFNPDFLVMGTILAILIVFKHKANIVRLIRGEEPKIGERKKEAKSHE